MTEEGDLYGLSSGAILEELQQASMSLDSCSLVKRLRATEFQKDNVELHIRVLNRPMGYMGSSLQHPRADPVLASLFLWLIVGIEYNAELAAKVSCGSLDSFDHIVRNYWIEQQKSNDYMQKEEMEKLHFGDGETAFWTQINEGTTDMQEKQASTDQYRRTEDFSV
ncbi:hypothetical protein AAES_97956 [Amazona aestiva]|uniref:Uncharacterized protein n=1 Tax=Amazona aestiva TaxID=12930 RepID=A0A0Q3PGT8_AMAAE|nr:hypothetical protein AAES_97956 [Amazona aestiva]